MPQCLILLCSNLSMLLLVASKQKWKKQEWVFLFWQLSFKAYYHLSSQFCIMKFLLSPCFSISAHSYCLSLSPSLHIILKVCIQDQIQYFSRSPPVMPKSVSQMSLLFIPWAFPFSEIPSVNSSHLMSKVWDTYLRPLLWGLLCNKLCFLRKFRLPVAEE